MQHPHDLLVYELSRMYVFEQHNVETLTALAVEVDAALPAGRWSTTSRRPASSWASWRSASTCWRPGP